MKLDTDNLERLARALNALSSDAKNTDGWEDAEGDLLASAEAIAELIRLRGEVERMQWQDIRTAPKDEKIDIWAIDNGNKGRRVTDCYYDHICDEWRTSAPALKLHCVKARYVTHWMPRPAAPAAGSRHD